MRIVLTRRDGLGSPDGASIFIVSLAQALIELWHEMRIVLGDLEDPARYRKPLAPRVDLPIVALSDKPRPGLASALRLAKRCDAFRRASAYPGLLTTEAGRAAALNRPLRDAAPPQGDPTDCEQAAFYHGGVR